MIRMSAVNHQSPALLAVSCSDARLTAEDAAGSWKSRLGFDGAIFEVRCPGGGLALADTDSAFYKSALDSFKLLSSGRSFSTVILAFHEDCAYFNDKYGAGTMADTMQRKWQLIDQATKNVSEWSGGLAIRPFYLTLAGTGDCACGQTHQAPAGHAPQHPEPHRADAPPRRAAQAAAATTLRGFNRVVEERLLVVGGSVEDALSQAEDQSGANDSIPPWRIERHAREFLELLRSGGRRNPQDLRQLVRAFVKAYAGEQLPNWQLRSIMNELNEIIDTGATALPASVN
jgi:hypothetical protein